MARLNRLRYDGVSHQDWTAPSLAVLTRAHDGMPETSDWDALDRSQKRHVRHHFLVTTGGTDAEGLPETFGQLKLPVVTPNHKLSKRAVDDADARMNQVEGLGDVESELRTRITNLQEELGE